MLVTSFGWNEGVLPKDQPGADVDVRAWFYEDAYLRFAGSPYKVLTEDDKDVHVDANPASDLQNSNSFAPSSSSPNTKKKMSGGTFGSVPLDSPTAAANGAPAMSPTQRR